MSIKTLLEFDCGFIKKKEKKKEKGR